VNCHSCCSWNCQPTALVIGQLVIRYEKSSTDFGGRHLKTSKKGLPTWISMEYEAGSSFYGSQEGCGLHCWTEVVLWKWKKRTKISERVLTIKSWITIKILIKINRQKPETRILYEKWSLTLSNGTPFVWGDSETWRQMHILFSFFELIFNLKEYRKHLARCRTDTRQQ